jgi:hypothetical protein
MKFNKSYPNEGEEIAREKIFKQNLLFLKRHHSEKSNGTRNYLLGLTKFSDVSRDNFQELFLKGKPFESITEFETNVIPEVSVPKSVDWRDERIGVQEDTLYGISGFNGWAYAISALLEYSQLLKTGVHKTVNTKGLLECSKPPILSSGSEDELITALSYVANDGLSEEGISSCNERKSKNQLGKITRISSKEAIGILKALSRGPLITSLHGSSAVFQFYIRGIIDQCEEYSNSITHYGLLLGYGESEGHKHYWLQNSWGRDWGENGFARISRFGNQGKGGICSVEQVVYFVNFENQD